MPSQINPNAINGEYPVAGVNNNTQGFRNNFTATANNFEIAAAEITDLQNKTILTAPLTDGSANVSNNLNSMPMSGGVYRDYSLAVVDHGTLTTTATEQFDFAAGAVHTVVLNGASATTTVSPVNFPGNGFSEIILQVSVQNTTHQLSFNGLTVAIGAGIAGYNANTGVVSFAAAETYTYTFGSLDGTNWVLTQAGAAALARNYTPTTAYGALGDTVGQIAYDNSFVYICVGNYNGITKIWTRAAITNW